MPPATKRKGHGRRCKPKDLPRRREEIAPSEAEKVCACCGTLKSRAGPILARFSNWLEAQHRQATPKSLYGQAIEYSRNQWASLVHYLDDARFAIDNGEAERAIRRLAVGRGN